MSYNNANINNPINTEEDPWPEVPFNADSSWSEDTVSDSSESDGYMNLRENHVCVASDKSDGFKPVCFDTMPPCFGVCWNCHGCLDCEEQRQKAACPYSACTCADEEKWWMCPYEVWRSFH